jgi:hypothetical protein
MCTACFYSPVYIKGVFANGLCLSYLHWTVSRDATLYTHTHTHTHTHSKCIMNEWMSFNTTCIYIYMYSWVCVTLSPEMGEIRDVYVSCVTPKDRDEVYRREVCESDGWVCVLEVIGVPSEVEQSTGRLRKLNSWHCKKVVSFPIRLLE